jgi:nucleoside 2-deoxyribosyltransferase
MKKVYLAGPTVFHPDADAIFAVMKGILSEHKLMGVVPVDNQSQLKGIPPGPDLNSAIYSADVGIMRSVDAAIFDISPFRNANGMRCRNGL